MGKFSLQVRATLEGLEEIYPNHPEHIYFLKLKCTSCGETSDKWHDVCEAQTYPGKTGKFESHFIAKCKLCGRENSLNISSGSYGKYSKDDEGNFKSIVSFDCRGLEPTDFSAGEGWIAKVEGSGKVFDGIDLAENEWVEYDEKSKQSVGIYELESRFLSVK